jgi:large subunit ribosomal protein L9
VVRVKDGYGRNFLIPHGKAKRATENNMAEFETKRAELEKQQALLLAAAHKRVKDLEGYKLEILQKSGVDGKLFGSVSNIDIAEALNKAGLKVVKAEIRMPDGPLKVIGDFPIIIALHHDVTTEIVVTVIGEDA